MNFHFKKLHNKMNKYFLQLLFVSVCVLVITACSGNSEKLPEGVHRIVVGENMVSGKYTYINADEDGATYWIAVPEMPVNVGDTLYYSKSMEMKNFHSKTLDRTFESILFVEDISDKIMGAEETKAHPKIETEKKEEIKVDALPDGITVAKAFSDKKSLSGQTVKIKGQVTKFNAEILDRNWIHIQDGTNDGDNFDLLVTSTETASVGEIIVVTGKLSLDKDFGAGYKYSVLIEDARIAREQ